MAETFDDLDDLNELVSDEVEESPAFIAASQHIQKTDLKLENATLLQLYAYYKQGTLGDCSVERPKWYEYRAKAKWDAWNEVKGTLKADAQRKYVQIVESLDPKFNHIGSLSKKEGWVTVSTLQKVDDDCREDTLIFQLVKSGCCKAAEEYFSEKIGEAEIDGLDEDGMALIHWAADRDDVGMIEVLLKFGCDVDVKDCDGQTALHYASSCGHLGTLHLLLKQGADVKAVNSDGLDVLSVAYDEDVEQVIRNFVV